MKFLAKLEKKIGKYSIPNLTKYLVACTVIGYVLSMLIMDYEQYMEFNPHLIMQGQVWRIVTWLICPPIPLNVFFIFFLVFYYHIGKSLEYAWGEFYYNLYIFSGLLFNIVGAFLVYFIIGVPISVGMYYVYLTSFLAYCFSFPDLQILFMFFIPIKVKYLGYIDLGIIAVDFYMAMYYQDFISAWGIRVQIIFSLLNFLIFMFLLWKGKRLSRQTKKRQKNFKQQIRHQMRKSVSVHRCAVCGRTKDEYPELEFRFCSKCKGNYEYCQEHLFTHSHVK